MKSTSSSLQKHTGWPQHPCPAPRTSRRVWLTWWATCRRWGPRFRCRRWRPGPPAWSWPRSAGPPWTRTAPPPGRDRPTLLPSALTGHVSRLNCSSSHLSVGGGPADENRDSPHADGRAVERSAANLLWFPVTTARFLPLHRLLRQVSPPANQRLEQKLFSQWGSREGGLYTHS